MESMRLRRSNPSATSPARHSLTPVFGEEVRVEVVERDRYGREVGNVHVGDR
jgi:hypothetical protein